MSVVAFYRVQCSGPECGKWLADVVDGQARITMSPGRALVFTTWSEADKTASEAGWHDGSQGQYAPCTCERKSERDYFGAHPLTCRRMSPRLVPLCDPCRARTDTGEAPDAA